MAGMTSDNDFHSAIEQMQKLRSSKTMMASERFEEQKYAAGRTGIQRASTFRTVTKTVAADEAANQAIQDKAK